MRNTFLDCTRGLGMCLVVFGHVQRGLHDAHLLPANYPFERIDFPLYTFHMPLFFLLAGLYVWPGLERGRAAFLGSKLTTIVAPYFIWSIIQGGVQIAMAGSTNHAVALADWPRLFYAPLGQFWFLYALMIWQLLALACNRHGLALAAIAIAALAAGTMLPDSFAATTLKMGVFFAAGAAIGPALEARIAPLANGRMLIVCCIAFGVSILAIWGIAPIYSWQALPAAIFGMTVLAIVCYRANRTRARAALAFCGQRSMHIYVMHIMAAAGMRIVFMKAGIHNPYALLSTGTAAGILLPLGASQVFGHAKEWLRNTLPAKRAAT